MAVYPPGKPKRYDPIRKKGDLPPHAPGEYRITTRFLGRILYIGETADLQRRMGEHLRTAFADNGVEMTYDHLNVHIVENRG